MDDDESEPADRHHGVVRVRLRVLGMMCQHNCGATVEGALRSNVAGVVDAVASFAGSWAEVSVDRTHERWVNVTAHHLERDVGRACVSELEGVGFDAHVFENKDYEEQVRYDEAHRVREEAKKRERELARRDEVGADDGAAGDDSNSSSSVVLEVLGMSCAVCTGRVEQTLRSVEGVNNAVVTLATNRATVTLDPTHLVSQPTTDPRRLAERCADTLTREGYEASVVRVGNGGAGGGHGVSLRDSATRMEHARARELSSWRDAFLLALLFTGPMMAIHYGGTRMIHNTTHHHDHDHAVVAPTPDWKQWAMLYLATPVQFGVGRRFYTAAWSALQHRVLGMDALVVLGTTAAYVYSLIVFCLQIFCPDQLSNHSSSSSSSTSSSSETMHTTFETGAMLLMFVTFGKFLEAYAKGKTASALQKLMELQPSLAFRLTVPYDDNDDTKQQQQQHQQQGISSLSTEEVPLSSLRIDDLLLVLPGSRIPTDGVLVASEGGGGGGSNTTKHHIGAYVDESPLSGEPFPVAKRPGDAVYGSCVNQLSTLLVRATATGEDTLLARVVRLVEDAQTDRAPVQALADRLAGLFAPTVLGLAALTFTGWYLLPAHPDPFPAIMSAIAVVVVACPCALGLATPTAVMVGTGVGARHGLLIKGGSVLEGAYATETVVMDKTGTLTSGKAVLGEYRPYEHDHLGLVTPPAVPPSKAALWLAACAETASQHPLADAVTNAARGIWGGDIVCARQGVHVKDATVIPGEGVECTVVIKDDTKHEHKTVMVRVGKRAFVCDEDGNMHNQHVNKQQQQRQTMADMDITSIRQQGQVGVYVAASTDPSSSPHFHIIAVIGIVDPIKPNARSCVQALHAMNMDVWLCTGDHQLTAQAVARQLGIPNHRVSADTSPEGKADLVTSLQQSSRSTSRVAVVGDGINDSVALARADVGIALGAGTEVAVEAADIVLVRSDLHDVVVALHLSRVVFRRIQWNFVWALGYNMFALPFAAGALYPLTGWKLPPALAGLMMAFSSVSVVTSSLLLRTYQKPSVDEDGNILWSGAGLCGCFCSCGSGSVIHKTKERVKRMRRGGSSVLNVVDEDHDCDDGVERATLKNDCDGVEMVYA